MKVKQKTNLIKKIMRNLSKNLIVLHGHKLFITLELILNKIRSKNQIE
jgi:hypothetical protein